MSIVNTSFRGGVRVAEPRQALPKLTDNPFDRDLMLDASALQGKHVPIP